MIEPRAASGLLVSALIRRIGDDGGHAMVLERGNEIAGAILLLLADRGVNGGCRERVWRIEGGYGLERVGPAAEEGQQALDDYVARRRKSDPDLWVVELDHRKAAEIAAELL